jgi:hypothetical protein
MGSTSGANWGRGWALAYRRYSKDYVAAEDEANRRMWRDIFVKPLGVARIVTASGHRGTSKDSPDFRRQARHREQTADKGAC